MQKSCRLTFYTSEGNDFSSSRKSMTSTTKITVFNQLSTAYLARKPMILLNTPKPQCTLCKKLASSAMK